MEILAALVLALWVAGIVAFILSWNSLSKTGTDPTIETFKEVAANNPIAAYGLLSVLVVFWPAPLLFSILQKVRG